MLLERGIAGDEHGGRIALEENPQVAVSRVRDRFGHQWRLADAAIQRKLGQDRLDVRVIEAMTPADPGPQENLAVLGKRSSDSRYVKRPRTMPSSTAAVGDARAPVSKPPTTTLVSITAIGRVTPAGGAPRASP